MIGLIGTAASIALSLILNHSQFPDRTEASGNDYGDCSVQQGLSQNYQDCEPYDKGKLIKDTSHMTGRDSSDTLDIISTDESGVAPNDAILSPQGQEYANSPHHQTITLSTKSDDGTVTTSTVNY